MPIVKGPIDEFGNPRPDSFGREGFKDFQYLSVLLPWQHLKSLCTGPLDELGNCRPDSFGQEDFTDFQYLSVLLPWSFDRN